MARGKPVAPVELGNIRPASGDSARAAPVNPVSATEARAAQAGNLGPGGALEGIAKLSLGVAGMLKKQDIDRDQIMAVDLESRVMRSIEEEKAQLDPMAPDYAQRLKEIVTRSTQTAVQDAQFRTREVQDETSRRLARIGATVELGGVEDRRKSIAAEGERVYKQRLDTLYGEIRKDPDGYETYVTAFQADAVRLRGGIPPDRLRVIATAAGDGMLAAKVEGYAQKGRYGDARKFLDTNSGSFTPETNRALRANINALEDKARTEYIRASTDNAGGTMIEIIKQRNPDAPQTVTQERLDEMVKTGRVRKSDAVSLYAALAAGDRERSLEIDRNRSAINNWATGTANGDDTDRAYRIILGQVAEKRGANRDKIDTLNSPEALEALDIVAQKGVIPPMVSRQIENLANSGGPGSGDIEIANLAKAAAIYKATKDKYPGAKWTFDNNERLNLVIEHAKANGGNIEQAARDVIKGLPADAKADTERVEAGRKVARDTDWEKESRVVLGDWMARQLTGFGGMLRTAGRVATNSQVIEGLGGTPLITRGQDSIQIPQDLQSEYRANFERHFRLSGRTDAAKAAALEQIQREWSVTYVAGAKQPYVMKNAPATFLPPERAWLKDDLDTIMASETEKFLKTKGWVPVSDERRAGAPAYVLEADRRTLAEAAAKDPKRPVSYQIKVLREDRLYHVVTGARIALPTDDELKALPQYKQRLEQFDHADQARQAREALEKRIQRRRE